jgi:hypothetical protein
VEGGFEGMIASWGSARAGGAEGNRWNNGSSTAVGCESRWSTEQERKRRDRTNQWASANAVALNLEGAPSAPKPFMKKTYRLPTQLAKHMINDKV